MPRRGKKPAFDPGDPLLPVAGKGALSGIRQSHRSRWRAGVLIAVHALIALHITHFVISGRTLSPVEPSEAMYTLEVGQLNAGFIFFAVALLSTAIFGRFFCGWGCHIVALQDLCGWLLKRLSIRPRPLRSRLLLLAPMVLALYMFVWPTVRRFLFPGVVAEFPGFSNHLMTSGFWDTFPGPLFTTLTFLTCGFAAVYFLGAKGFCTYGCPYGAFFGVLDRVAPGRILVTDACEQCGHCTATCTSNVLVHDEVRRFGRVVDPGCMKCMDCVSVCPKDALYFGFAKPLATQPAPSKPAPKKPGALSWPEEFGVAGVCLIATLAFRGLYDGPPLLMSLGLGGITALLALKLWRLIRKATTSTVRLQNLSLRLGGELQPAGRVFAALALAWLLFTAHSAFVQWHRYRGAQALEQTEATRADVLSAAHRYQTYSAAHIDAVERAERHFAAADRWGLRPVLEIKLGRVWTHLLREQVDEAQGFLAAAIALVPDRGDLHDDRVELLSSRGLASEARAALRAKVEGPASTAADGCRLAGMLAAAAAEATAPEGREAIERYLACAEAFPESFETHYNLGGLLRRSGHFAEAIESLGTATALRSEDFDAHVELGLALQARGEAGDARGARDAFARAVAIRPNSPESLYHLSGLIQQLDAEIAGR